MPLPLFPIIGGAAAVIAIFAAGRAAYDAATGFNIARLRAAGIDFARLRAGAKDYRNHSANHKERKHAMSEQGRLTKEQFLVLQVTALKQTARATNCLQAAKLYYIGDVIQLTEDELQQVPNLTTAAIKELKEKLDSMNLTLGTKLENWPPADLPYPPEDD